MPFMGVRRHLDGAEAAHLRADRLQRLVETGIADAGGALVLAEERDEAGAVFRRVAVCDQGIDGIRAGGRHGLLREAERRQPEDLALAHRNAAENLGCVFAGTDAQRIILDGAVAAFRLEALAIGLELAKGRDIGRKPGQAMSGVLLGLQPGGGNPAVDEHLLPHRGNGFPEQGLEAGERRCDQCDRIRPILSLCGRIGVHGLRPSLCCDAA